MIGSINRTKEILNKYNLRAKKGFGQNFLIDTNILQKIVNVSNISEDIGVIEIGPGIGALTENLLINSKKVLAYEIDSDMINVLENELKSFTNFKLINKDILKVDITNDLEYFSDCEKIIVVSNLPYYITTPIITKILEYDQIEEMYLMVQKEVGLRLTGKPKTKDYNALSVFMEYKSNSKIEFNVSRNCFLPVPNVDSVIISIKKKKSEYALNNEAHFLKFVQTIFAQKRKTLINNLGSNYNIKKDELINILNNNGYSPSVRSEELSLKEIYDLYMSIFKSP